MTSLVALSSQKWSVMFSMFYYTRFKLTKFFYVDCYRMSTYNACWARYRLSVQCWYNVYWRVWEVEKNTTGDHVFPWLHLMHGIGYAQYSNLCGHQEQLLGAIWRRFYFPLLTNYGTYHRSYCRRCTRNIAVAVIVIICNTPICYTPPKKLMFDPATRHRVTLMLRLYRRVGYRTGTIFDQR